MHRRLVGRHEVVTRWTQRRAPGRPHPDLAAAAWSDLAAGELGAASFAWAGPVDEGFGHYYAVRHPQFLLEYDSVQNDANHIHSVWRDLRLDWGHELLAAHRAAQH